ncbi:MAG TPA: 3-oxoadipate enol-lactonase [Devosia sp.]|jgi:3-oxoadipate enol-lactonase|uniref:3-oxoadipate enol-lactonase n=1 Tax=Devosia sp. TaxID=1871048 RepID=UPI002DDD4620|nr:3-oxoadipate enol-lactonase [Devosia sp.]HEV2514085.1 3-oxoadipate enol-lactonase [Devosia sp.]
MSFASINGTTLHYQLTGALDGLPVILVNSLGTNLHIWDDLVPLLGLRYRVLCYDKRGHGLSDAPPGPYRLDDHVADLLGLVEQCGFRQFSLCGISIGGMIAMRIAAQHPGRVRRLVLCDTAARIGTPQMWNDRIAQVRQGGMAAVADQVLERWVSPGYRELRAADFAGWRNMLERCPAEGYVASCASVRDADLTADIGHISVPTRVIAGENDLATPPETVRQLADAVAGAEYRLVRRAGHVPSIEQPEWLCELICEHLREVVHA